MLSRLARAADFVTALQAASRQKPASWHSIASIGEAAGITDDPAQLEQAAGDAERAGLVERWSNHVQLTAKGRRLAAE